MSFVSDELAKALKCAYMVEESDRQRGEGVCSSSKVGKKYEDSSKGKRLRKHKHRKHSKSKSKDRKKNKKRKRKSRSPSRSRSESRSKSRSRSSERAVSFKSEDRRCSTSKSRSKSPNKTTTRERKVDESPIEEIGQSRSCVKEIEIGFKQVSISTLFLNVSDKHKKESEGIDSQNSQEKDKLKSQQDDTASTKSSNNCKTSRLKSPHSSNSEKLVESNSQHQSEGCKKYTSQSKSQSEEHSGRKRSSSVSSKASDVEVSNSPSSKLHSKSRSASRDISVEKKSSPKVPFKELSSTRNSEPRSHSKNQSNIEKSMTKCPSNGQPVRRKKSRSLSLSSSCSYQKESRSRSRNKRSHSKSLKESESRSRSRDKKSQSRSRSRSKSCSKRKRSHSKSRSRSRHKRSRSRLRSRSRHKRRYSRSRSRSRSHKRYKSRSRSHSRRKRSCSNTRRRSRTHRHYQKFSPPRWKRNVASSRWHSRSPSQSQSSPSRRRHKARSSLGSGRSISRSYSRSRSRSWSRRRRSHSFSRGRRSRSRSISRVRGRKSASQDRQKGRNKTKSRSKSKENTELNTLKATSGTTVNKISSVIDKPVATEMTCQQSKIAARSGGKTIAELTAFCKKLADEKEDPKSDNSTVTGAVNEDSPPVTHHPFLLKEKPDVSIPPVIFPVKHLAALSVDANKPLQEVFPVSCGSKHRENEIVNQEDGMVPNIDGGAVIQALQKNVFEETPAEKFDISELVAKRMEAQRRLETDPKDIESMLTLQEIQMKMQNWCQSNVKPGQFTGELVKSLLPKEDLNGGYQAWAKKDMFQNLAPVTGGIGMKLLQKMGWRPGQVIGKRGEGFAEPIPLIVKIDRKGLSTVKEKPTKKALTVDLQGKHPVSALAEFCSKRKWQLPEYSLVFDHGPAHSKQFLFKVLVNGTEYQPAVVCGNKKQAKAQAAIFALKGLGLIPEDTEISAM